MAQTKKYTLRIEERIYNRIKKHIRLLKHLNAALKQSEWIESAILEKIDREKGQKMVDYIPSEKHFSFTIDSKVDAIIEEKVKLISEFRSSFSKKQWILDAVEEKLKIEEKSGEINSQLIMKNMLKESPQRQVKESLS